MKNTMSPNIYYKTNTIYADFLLINRARNNITIKEKDGQVTLIRSGSPIGNCPLGIFKNNFIQQEGFEHPKELTLVEEHQFIRKDIETLLYMFSDDIGRMTDNRLHNYISKLHKKFNKLSVIGRKLKAEKKGLKE